MPSAESALEDRNRWTFASFLLIGIGNLLPFFAFVTITGYYKDRLCTTEFEETFTTYFNFAYNLCGVFGLLVSLYYCPANVTITNQVRIPLIISFVLLVCSTILVTVEVEPYTLFFLSLLIIMVVGFFSAIMNGGLFALAGIHSKSFTSALMIGAGASGTVVSFLSFFTNLASAERRKGNCVNDDYYSNDDGSNGAVECPGFKVSSNNLVYFCITAFVLLICVIVFELLSRQLNKNHSAKPPADDRKSNFLNTVTIVSPMQAPYVNLNASLTSEQDESSLATSKANLSLSTVAISQKVSQRDVLREIFIPSMSVFLNYTLSLCIFPSYLVLIIPGTETSCMFSHVWASFIFICWNLSDFLGRFIANKYTLREYITSKNIHKFVSCRAVFLILFLLCNVGDSSRGIPNVFKADAWVIIFIVLFSGSSGYFANISMMLGPESVVEVPGNASLTDEKKSLAGVIMVMSLTLGLLCGSMLSFLFVYGSLNEL